MTDQPVNARTLTPADYKAAKTNAIRSAFRSHLGVDRSPATATAPMQPDPSPVMQGSTASVQTPPPPAAAERFNARTLTREEYTARRRELLGGR